MATGDGEVLGGRKRRQASRGNTLAKRIARKSSACHGNFGLGEQNSWKSGPPDH